MMPRQLLRRLQLLHLRPHLHLNLPRNLSLMPPRSRWVWELGFGGKGRAGKWIPEWSAQWQTRLQKVSPELKLEASGIRKDVGQTSGKTPPVLLKGLSFWWLWKVTLRCPPWTSYPWRILGPPVLPSLQPGRDLSCPAVGSQVHAKFPRVDGVGNKGKQGWVTLPLPKSLSPRSGGISALRWGEPQAG